jgi:hypothetical protein
VPAPAPTPVPVPVPVPVFVFVCSYFCSCAMSRRVDVRVINRFASPRFMPCHATAASENESVHATCTATARPQSLSHALSYSGAPEMRLAQRSLPHPRSRRALLVYLLTYLLTYMLHSTPHRRLGIPPSRLALPFSRFQPASPLVRRARYYLPTNSYLSVHLPIYRSIPAAVFLAVTIFVVGSVSGECACVWGEGSKWWAGSLR